MVDQVPTMLVSELNLMKQLGECKDNCIRLCRILLRIARMNEAGKAIYEQALTDENVGKEVVSELVSELVPTSPTHGDVMWARAARNSEVLWFCKIEIAHLRSAEGDAISIKDYVVAERMRCERQSLERLVKYLEEMDT